jgi:hypothetical protein
MSRRCQALPDHCEEVKSITPALANAETELAKAKATKREKDFMSDLL